MKSLTPSISVFRRGGPRGVFYAQVNRTTPFSLSTPDAKEAELWKQGKLAEILLRLWHNFRPQVS